MRVEQPPDLGLEIAIVNGLGVAHLDRRPQIGKAPEIIFVGGQLLVRRGDHELLGRHGYRQGLGVSVQALIEHMPQLLVTQQQLVTLLVVPVGNGLEQVQQIRMPLRQPGHFFVDAAESALEVGFVVIRQRAVGSQGVVQFTQHTGIVDDVPEILRPGAVLIVIQAIDTSNGLQQRMFTQPAGQVEHGIARRVKTGQQFVHHDQNLGRFAVLEPVDDLLVVLLFGPVPLDHLFPERHHRIARGFVRFLVAFADVRRRDDDL
ncbi:hypothetical protein D9M69_413360 [compost metagenome]